jgi:hypothetical protein
MLPTIVYKIKIGNGNEEEEFVPRGTETNNDKMKKTYPTTPMTGVITAIKLAIVPNFLPDSSDTFDPSGAILYRFRDKLFDAY